jgi:hypothetical protein
MRSRSDRRLAGDKLRSSRTRFPRRLVRSFRSMSFGVGSHLRFWHLLTNRPGQMVSREELQKEIWTADTFVDFNHGLNAAVNKLRETLSDSAEEPGWRDSAKRGRSTGAPSGCQRRRMEEKSCTITPSRMKAAWCWYRRGRRPQREMSNRYRECGDSPADRW